MKWRELHRVARFAIKLLIVCVVVVLLSAGAIRIIELLDPDRNIRAYRSLDTFFVLMIYLFFYSIYIAIGIFIVGLFLKGKGRG